MRQALLVGMAVLLLMPAAATAADGLNANGNHYIFLTSLSYDGNLGGLSGADGICREVDPNLWTGSRRF